MRGCVPRDRSLLGISPTDENGTFDVLVATFENDWIIGRFVAVDDEFLVISIAEVRNLGRFDVVLPLQRYGSPERNVPGSVPCNVCLLYTSDAADEEDSVDLGGRRIIKKQQKEKNKKKK